jgi:chemotaxis protein histidine kinase CheA
MTTDPPVGNRRRPYVFPGRQKRMFTRFTDDEYAEVTTAAHRFGLTPTGFCAQASLDAARNLPTGTVERMEYEALGNLQGELLQARVMLNQLRAELDHTRDDRRASPDDLDKVIARTAHAVADLDSITSRIHRRLARL